MAGTGTAPPGGAAPSGGTDPYAAQVEAVRAGYGTAGPALELGALLVDAGGTPTPRPDVPVRIPLSMLTRHGLVAGATGTGKTKTLQVMAEQLSAAGVPVFLADIKGDLSGIAVTGTASDGVVSRARATGQDWQATASPTEFLALGGLGTGVPVRASISSFGPDLLARVLDLNATQTSSLALVFHHADTAGLPLLDLADLRAVVQHLVSDEGKADLVDLGGLSKATAGVILRELVAFAAAGADAFFGEPELDPAELLRVDAEGRGIVTCLELAEVQDRPALFSTFLLWLLAELFESLPEVGDLDRPKLVFFFDEAHLLFTGASKTFLEKITQTVRLIRSKGVGIVFVTQTPEDVPGDVLAQLGSRVQHALRAYTPDDAKALRATVSTFPTSGYDLGALLTSLGTGEAVVTVLSERGAPTPVAWTMLRAPQGSMSPMPADALGSAVAASPLMARYGVEVDRESAYEMLSARLGSGTAVPADRTRGRTPDRTRGRAPSSADQDVDEDEDRDRGADGLPGPGESWDDVEPARRGTRTPAPRRRAPREERGAVQEVLASPAVRGFLRSAGTALGREITRGIFGTARRRR
ncbi:helicase HerA-like domain-containing protein [Aquipuribacter hungaricus]|uniref:Helicase HerA-like domain-containing protein n=1 Tax=Aquipuribacter hungaricus TaxID=545624 RepID=A0ABV7WL28_9MICO